MPWFFRCVWVSALIGGMAMPVYASNADYRWIQPFSTQKLKPIYRKKTEAGEWLAWGTDQCQMQVRFTPVGKPALTKTWVPKDPNGCSAVLDFYHHQIDANTYVQDWPSERGGNAMILHASEAGLAFLVVDYWTTDDDSISVKKQGNRLIVQGSQGERQVIAVRPDGELLLLSKRNAKSE